MTKLKTIEGIGPVLSGKFESLGIKTVADLLDKCGNPPGRTDISSRVEISEARLSKLVNCADLMRVKGIGGEYSELLEASGVDSVPELAQRNPASLLAKMESVNEEKRLVRALPSETQVRNWIRRAQALPRAVSH